jgi:hypothetical protein
VVCQTIPACDMVQLECAKGHIYPQRWRGSFANGDGTFWLKSLHVLKSRAVPAEGTVGTMGAITLHRCLGLNPET